MGVIAQLLTGNLQPFFYHKEAANHRSVAQLAHLDNDAAHRLVSATLSRLARCPAPASTPL